jgi:hypothetical protein
VAGGVRNHSPTLNLIGTQTLRNGRTDLILPLIATDIDGDPLRMTVYFVGTSANDHDVRVVGSWNHCTFSAKARTYIGKVKHKDETHVSEHTAVVLIEVFDPVQNNLKRNDQSGGTMVRNKHSALL